MSFILDALRKAEHRNRDQHLHVPGGPKVLMDETPDKPTNWRFMGALFATGLALLAVGLWFGSRTEEKNSIASVSAVNSSATTGQTELPTSTPQSDPSNSEAGSRPAIRDTGARALDREVASRSGNNAVQRPATSNSSSSQADAATPVAASTQSARPAVQPGRVENEVLPEYSEIQTTGTVALPQLHLDVHVYSSQESKRFAFINLVKYQQGDSISGDLTLESIDQDSVVLDFRGFRFRLRPE